MNEEVKFLLKFKKEIGGVGGFFYLGGGGGGGQDG